MVRESLGHPKDSHIIEVVPVSCLSHSPIGSPGSSQGLPCLSHSPIGTPQTILRTRTLGSCPSILSVPQLIPLVCKTRFSYSSQNSCTPTRSILELEKKREMWNNVLMRHPGHWDNSQGWGILGMSQELPVGQTTSGGTKWVSINLYIQNIKLVCA